MNQVKTYCPHMRHCNTLAAIPHIARCFFRGISSSRKWCDTPPSWALSFTQAHLYHAIPHFATCRAIMVRYPIREQARKSFAILNSRCESHDFIKNENSAQRGSFWDRCPADIWGLYARMSRPKTSVRTLKILGKKSKHLGADIHDPKARTSTNLRDFQKLRSETLWAEFSFPISGLETGPKQATSAVGSASQKITSAMRCGFHCGLHSRYRNPLHCRPRCKNLGVTSTVSYFVEYDVRKQRSCAPGMA